MVPTISTIFKSTDADDAVRFELFFSYFSMVSYFSHLS